MYSRRNQEREGVGSQGDAMILLATMEFFGGGRFCSEVGAVKLDERYAKARLLFACKDSTIKYEFYNSFRAGDPFILM
jgi:hypothetical protein